MDIAFHGAEFHGWQKQPGCRTVQGEIELWLERLMGTSTPVGIVGAGRTDAGVHATGMVAHFDSTVSIETEALLHRLRVALPHDLVVTDLHPVAEEFHARYSATARTYRYCIRLGRWPFDRDREWQIHEPLDLTSLQTSGRAILGRHDFSGFCRAESRRESNLCNVTSSEWTSDGPRLIYLIRADRFLHEMVRLIVGSSVAIARGHFEPRRMLEILQSGDVRLCADAAPPHGLTLELVEYPDAVAKPLDFN
jgi:tRNA pseudouridine38-40 synthase